MGLFNRESKEERSLREVVSQYKWQAEYLEESLRTLEQGMVDGEWRRIGANLEREFTRDGLDDMMAMSRAMYLSHPLIQRAVNVTTYYTWGQGYESGSEDESLQDIIQEFKGEYGNQIELYNHQARLLTDVDQLVDGNTFIALFKTNPVSVRSVPAEEIRRIHRDPKDRNQVMFYRRVWSSTEFDPATGNESTVQREELYPDVNYDPRSKPETLGGTKVNWDAPIIHQKTGGLKQMVFGIPSTYASIDWARAYKKFLEDWHTIVSSLARFAWTATTKADKRTALGRKLNRARPSAVGELAEGESNAPPPAGNVWIGGPGDQLAPINKSGTTTSADDARASRLMVGAGMDLPDTILSGDADVGNLATAKTLDRPTELAMRSRQEMWAYHERRILNFVIDHERNSREGVPQEELFVKFPSILEHDKAEAIKAIVSAATLEGRVDAGTMPREQVSRMLMQELEIDDIEEKLKDLGDEDRQELAQAVENLKESIDGLLG